MADNFRKSTIDEDLHSYDPYTHARTVITEPHRMTHDGFMFHASGKVTGMVDANVDEFLLVTAAGNFPHMQRMRFDFGGGDIDVQSYEGTTASNDGTPIDTHNTNRNSSNTADLILNSAPTLTGDGTLIHTTWAHPTANGQGKSAQGVSNIEAGEEWILQPSTKYLVRVTNNSGSTIDYRWELLFYEVGYEV